MIDSLFNFLSEALYSGFGISILASLGWGILSILLSPCHLTSIPLVIGYINSQGSISLRRTFYISLVFAVGILITIAILGIITVSMGRLMGDVGKIGNILVAGIFFLVGFYLLDIINLPWEKMQLKKTKKKGIYAALILGLMFGIGLGPCTFAFMAPVLGLAFETSQTNILASVVLLTAFAVGHCSVIIVSGTATKKVQQYLNWTENSHAVSIIKKICGALVMLGGIYLVYTNI